MMATEVNQTYFAWSQGNTTDLDGSQGVSVSQTFDHGSISFGRFELESLSWEKRSVFTNDRRHEEFGKFNGLVAQKKAYFEEYYKKIRELKASQQQNQQTELILEYCGDGSDSSQTGEEHMQAAELETPTGSSTTVVCDYVEQAAQETTSEQKMQCYDDHEEFSSSNIFSSAGISQQADQKMKENVSSGNSDCVDDIVQKNAISGHDGLAAVFENARTPKRIIDKDPRLRYASKIIPKSVKTLSDSPLDRTSVSKRTGSAKASTSINQKTKTDNVRSLQRPNATPQKMGTPRTHNLTSKEALGVTGVRRPSSAAGCRPSTGERHPITRATIQKPSDVSTPRRPSTAERHLVARERAQKQGNVTMPCRPSTSERRPVNRENAGKHAYIATACRPSTGDRRPVNRENAGKHAYIATACRPSTGDRRPVNRDSVLKLDPRTNSKTTAAVAHPRGATTTVGILKKASLPNATKSSKLELESNIKGPSRSKRLDMQVAGKQKSSSVNLPPRKLMSSMNSSIGESALGTIGRTKKKEGISATVQSRASTSKRTAPSQTGSAKGRTPNPPPPPPPPRRPSRTTGKPNAGNTSVGGGRKAKPSAPQWH